MTTQPVLISGGVAYPITAAQFDLARAHKPIGPVTGLAAPARPRAAAPTPPAPSPAEPVKPNGRALARASMLKQIGQRYGQDARAAAEAATKPRRDVDPKARTRPGFVSTKVDAPDGRAMMRQSMLATIERKHGKAERAKAEARLGIKAA